MLLYFKNILFTLLACIFCCSCRNIKLTDINVGMQICHEMSAKSFELLYTHQRQPNEKYYIEYVLHKSEALQSNRLDSNFIASYVAIQLYRGLSSKTLKKNEAISVIFDNKNDLQNFINPKYYYTLSELEIVNQSVNNIETYLKHILESNFSNFNIIDTNFCNLDTINYSIKQKIFRYDNIFTKFSYGFKEMNFNIKNTPLSCILVVVIISDKYDINKQTYIKILTNKLDNKIVDFLIED